MCLYKDQRLNVATVINFIYCSRYFYATGCKLSVIWMRLSVLLSCGRNLSRLCSNCSLSNCGICVSVLAFISESDNDNCDDRDSV